MSEIGVTAAQEFMPGSRVSVHRATGVYSQGMEGPELESALADGEGSVTFSTLSGFDITSGDKLWVIGRNPAGALHCVTMTAKALRSAARIKSVQAHTVSPSEDESPSVVKGARTTTNVRTKQRSPRKASPPARTTAQKPAAAPEKTAEKKTGKPSGDAPAKASAKASGKPRGKSGKK